MNGAGAYRRLHQIGLHLLPAFLASRSQGLTCLFHALSHAASISIITLISPCMAVQTDPSCQCLCKNCCTLYPYTIQKRLRAIFMLMVPSISCLMPPFGLLPSASWQRPHSWAPGISCWPLLLRKCIRVTLRPHDSDMLQHQLCKRAFC